MIKFKALLLNIVINSFLLLLLTLVIQNSSNKNEVNLIFFKTISLPLSFILGSSFIGGSFCSGIVQNLDFKVNKNIK